jgi:phosphopantetheine adenylyltransferase
MADLAAASMADFVICDFVCPLTEMRNLFKADYIVWMDTIERGRFEDTNKMFVDPEIYDFRIPEQNAEQWAPFVAEFLLKNKRRPVFDNKKETVQLLGRWQPWHSGHRALFERALAKTGQVCIMIRDCQGWNNSNPFDEKYVSDKIKKDLDPLYQGQYTIITVPNITNITYGRDVGYVIEQETFDDATHAISATKIRKDMGLS